MSITHTFVGSRHGGYGYYAFIEDNELVIGEDWPHEGGETYHGSYVNAQRALRTLEKEAPKLFNSITKYFEKHPEIDQIRKLEQLTPGTKFVRVSSEDKAEYMLIDMEVSKCFVFGDKLSGFVTALDLQTYKVHLFDKSSNVKLI